MKDESALHRRAREAGVIRDWTDAGGRRRRVPDDTLAAVLEALGDTKEEGEEPLVTAEIGEAARLPSGRRRRFDAPGYHEEEGVTVAVAPPRAWTVADAAPGRKIWGAAVQVPSLRDRRREAHGDFTSLARFASPVSSYSRNVSRPSRSSLPPGTCAYAACRSILSCGSCDASADAISPRVPFRVLTQSDLPKPALVEAFSRKKDLVFMDFTTDQTENVFPMVPGGKGLSEMILV